MSPAWQGRFRLLVTLLLILLLASTLARATWMVLGPAVELPPASTRTSSSVVTAGQPSGPSLEQVAALQLLGTAERGEALRAVPVEAPDTRLRLTLKGVMAARGEGFSGAIIADERNNEKSYRVGGEVPGGAKLASIHADRVILERSGRFETLRLPRELTAAAAPQHRAATSPQEQSIPAEAGELGQLRQRLLDNPQDLFQIVSIRPVNRDGALHGYRLTPRQYQEAFTSAGLRSGDVVVAINGISVLDNQALAGLPAQLASASELRLRVLHGTGTRDIVIRFD